MHESFAAIRARNEAFNKNNGPEALASFSAKSAEFVTNTRTFIIEGLPELSWLNPKLKKAFRLFHRDPSFRCADARTRL